MSNDDLNEELDQEFGQRGALVQEILARLRKSAAQSAERAKTVTDVIALDQNGHRFAPWPSEHWLKGSLDHLRRRLAEMYDTPSAALGLHHECTFCGQRPSLTLDGTVVRAIEPCPAAEGVPIEYTVTFNSGRIIVNDSLSPIYQLDDDTEHDYNTVLGQAETVLHMASKNMAFGPVGNSCPTLYRTPTGLQIGRYYNPETDEDELPQGFEAVAHIITDLWAYSVADYQEWLDKGGRPAEELRTWCGYDLVEITPGTYRVRHYTGLRNFDRDASPIVYADFELLPAQATTCPTSG